MVVLCRDESQPHTLHARFDPPQAPADPSMDHGDPHIPRRKRSKPTELIRPMELLAAANAAAARAAAGGRQDDHEDDYMPDNLSCLAAAAVAESESDAELARAPENGHQVFMKQEKIVGIHQYVKCPGGQLGPNKQEVQFGELIQTRFVSYMQSMPYGNHHM